MLYVGLFLWGAHTNNLKSRLHNRADIDTLCLHYICRLPVLFALQSTLILALFSDDDDDDDVVVVVVVVQQLLPVSVQHRLPRQLGQHTAMTSIQKVMLSYQTVLL